MLINVVTCLIFTFKITAPLVQHILADCVDKPPMRAAFLFMEQITWKPVIGFEGYYEVNQLAQVRTVEREVIRLSKLGKPNKLKIRSKIKVSRKTKLGYIQVALVRENITYNTYLHRIVAMAFVEKPVGCNVVNHKNGIKYDNRIDNLEWTTSSGNNVHALDNRLRTTRKSMSKQFIDNVIYLRSKGYTIAKISNDLMVTKSIVQGITSGTTYKRMR